MSFRKFIEESRLLLEYDENKTWAIHGPKIVKHILNPENKDDHESVKNARADFSSEHPEHHELSKQLLMSDFEHSDPTSNKKYVAHIARIYGAGGVKRHEDLGRMKPALEKFDDLAKRKIIPAEHRDIGKVKSLGQLEDLVDAHSEKMSGKEADRATHEKMKSEATITDKGDFTHIIPHTKDAASHFGKGTRWCTTSDGMAGHGGAEGETMFDHYNKQGPMQIMIPKKPQYDGEKYQYHMASGQMMNDRDEDVGYRKYGGQVEDRDGNARDGKIVKTPDAIAKHVRDYEKDADESAHDYDRASKHPEPSVYGRFINHYADSDQLHHYLKHEADGETVHQAFDNAHFKSNHIDSALENPNWEVREAALKHEQATTEHGIKGVNDPNPDVKVAALSNRPTWDEEETERNGSIVPTKMLHDVMDSPDVHNEVKAVAARNSNADSALIHKALDHEDYHVRAAGLRNDNAKTEHYEKAIGDKEGNIAQMAAYHYNLGPEAVDKGLKRGGETARVLVLNNNRMTSDQLKSAYEYNKHDGNVSAVIARHSNTDHNTLHELLKHADPEVRREAARNRSSDSTHLDVAMKDSDPHVRSAVGAHNRAEERHITAATLDPHPDVREAVSSMYSPAESKLTPQHLKNLLSHGKEGSNITDKGAENAAWSTRHDDESKEAALSHPDPRIRASFINKNNSMMTGRELRHHFDNGKPGERKQVFNAITRGHRHEHEVAHHVLTHPDEEVRHQAWHELRSQDRHTAGPNAELMDKVHNEILDKEAASEREYTARKAERVAARAARLNTNEGTNMSFKSFTDMEALSGKAQESGIDMSIINEVYNRGMSDWTEDTNKTASQYAFNRVNSFLAGGFAAKLDEDLLDEVSRDTLSNYIRKAKHVVTHTSEDSRVHQKSKKGIERAERKYMPKSFKEHVSDSFALDNSGEVIIERELIDPAKLLTVKRRDTKSSKVIQRHNEKNKSMRDLHRTETALKRGFGARNKHDVHFTDKGRHQLTDRWRDQRRERVSSLRKRVEKNSSAIRESEEYIAARQSIHDAHSESARLHAGTERDPELRRLDLHRSKKHAHASRVLEILKTKIAKKKK